MKKECLNKSNVCTWSKPTSSSIKNLSIVMEGHDIDHCYSTLHSKLHPNKSINNKDGIGKRGRGGSNISQTRNKVTSNLPQVRPMTKAKVVALPLHKINLFSCKNWSPIWQAKIWRRRRWQHQVPQVCLHIKYQILIWDSFAWNMICWSH